MQAFLREYSWPLLYSLLLHGALAAGLLIMALISAHRTPPGLQPLPIDAVVVDSQVLHAAQTALRQRSDQAAAQAARAASESRVAEEAKAQAALAKSAADALDAAKLGAAEQQRLSDTAKAAAAKQAAQAQAADAKLAEDSKRKDDARRAAADEKRAAEAKQAAEAKHAADERARKEREAELRKQLADEEHRSAVESGPLRDRYITLLRNKIQGAWIRPPSARVGIDCMVEVTQVPGGEVTSAHVTQCNGDAAVRQSIENAVYRASPLPDPPDPALFERNFVFRFRPNE